MSKRAVHNTFGNEEIVISKNQLYSLLHFHGCNTAEKEGWFDRYFSEYNEKREIGFKPEEYWDGHIFGIEMSKNTKECMKILYRIGWGQADHKFKVDQLEKNSGIILDNTLLKEIPKEKK